MSECHIVIPTIGKNEMIVSLLSQLERMKSACVRQVTVIDNGMPAHVREKCNEFNFQIIDGYGFRIYQMWNIGLDIVLSESIGAHPAIFNDDIILTPEPGWFESFLEPFSLSEDIWATCANYEYACHSSEIFKDVRGTFKDNGFAGFCFAINRIAYDHSFPRFEDRYNWWYGDDDLVHSVHLHSKRATMSLNAGVIHIDGGSQTVVQYTPEFNEMVARDRELYLSKWS